MIHDRYENAGAYRGAHARLWQGLEWLRATSLADLALGKLELDGDRLFALVQEYTTKPLNEGRFEAHRKYIDIQTLAVGRELIGWTHLSRVTVVDPYLDERDIAFFSGQGDLLTLTPGDFAVFFPHDAHMPGVQAAGAEGVKKIVVKVAV